jgi:ABC-2 type transport system ATP-binding protein
VGLDAVGRQLSYDRLIATYAEQPRTIVRSTHLIEEIGDLLESVLLIDRGRVLLAEHAESLRDSALPVSGTTDQVRAFGHGRQVLHTETLDSQSRAVVRTTGSAARAAAGAQGLTVEPTPLQQLVVALSRHSTQPLTAPAEADVPTHRGGLLMDRVLDAARLHVMHPLVMLGVL